MEEKKCKVDEESGTICICNFKDEAIIDGLLDPDFEKIPKYSENENIIIWNQETENYPYKIYVEKVGTLDDVNEFFDK